LSSKRIDYFLQKTVANKIRDKGRLRKQAERIERIKGGRRRRKKREKEEKEENRAT